MSHEEFFARYGQWEPVADTGYDQKARFTVEAMYKAFKARLIAELRVTTPELLERAELIDT